MFTQNISKQEMDSTKLKKQMDDTFALGNVNCLLEDLLQDILSMLPAKDFASAACVCKSWNKICNRILSRPKLATALSLNPSFHAALQEVLDKVLSEPIRPHFAIVIVGLNHNLEATHRFISTKLGSKIPIITNAADGIIGKDALTNRMKQIKWEIHEDDVPNHFTSDLSSHVNFGIVLVVGCVPGLKVEAIPLLRSKKDGGFPRGPKKEMIDNFLRDIKEYTSSVSDCTSPDAIIMFGDEGVDLKNVLVRMDNNMPKETVIVGDASGCFLFRSGEKSRRYPTDSYSNIDAVALVFTKENSSGVGGNIQFSLAVSNGIVPFGTRAEVRALVVLEGSYTLLTARMVGHPELLNIQGHFREIRARDRNPSFFIGVTHKKKHSNGSQRSYLTYYKITREFGDFGIIVDGVGIEPGDSFMFYHADFNTTVSSMINSIAELGIPKASEASTSHSSAVNSVHDKKEIFGGLIFSCSSRGDPQVGSIIMEGFPFYTNYPRSALAGLFCRGEIARVSTSLIPLDEEAREGDGSGNGDGGEDENSNSGGCFFHYHSIVHLLMSYCTPQR